MEKNILIVEDSQICQTIAKDSLASLGKISIVESCAEAKKISLSNKFDLLIIDLFLPDGNGIELLSELKLLPTCHFAHSIVVSGEDEISRKVAAFSLGADDYLVKPYIKLELKARAERLFSRNEDDFIFSDSVSKIRLNSLSYKAFVDEQGSWKDLNLTPHEFKVLNILIRNPDRIYSRNKLIDLVWGEDTCISVRTVDTHISMLRKKLGSLSQTLSCIRGEGYKWQNLSFQEIKEKPHKMIF